MENLIFSLNATVPVFVLMLLGLFFRKISWIDDVLASKLNRFVFLVPLPVLVFRDLAMTDFGQIWDLKFVLFCFGVTAVSITAAALISLLWTDKSVQGEFIQASYRSSAALLGIAFIQNIYGTSGMAPLMIIGSVPLYNIMAVLALSLFKPGQKGISRKVLINTGKGIITNPIIIGITIGIVWSLLEVPMPYIMNKTVENVAACATPLGLLAMGASFDINKVSGKLKPVITASVLKLVGFVAVFLPAAAALGFREEKLVAILVMLGSATTVSCFIMAKNMGHEGTLTSGVIMITTFFSAFTLTVWLYILKTMGLL